MTDEEIEELAQRCHTVSNEHCTIADKIEAIGRCIKSAIAREQERKCERCEELEGLIRAHKAISDAWWGDESDDDAPGSIWLAFTESRDELFASIGETP